MSQVLRIDPVTRLEGHGKIEIFLDDEGEVRNAYFQIPELRGFEKFCQGRRAEEMPGITARLCGVCPAAHHLAAAKAVDALYHVTPTAPARKLRELMYMAHFCHSHIAHFYVLAAPDFICGPDAPPAERNILGVVAKVGKELGTRVIDQRANAQKAQAILAGRATHMVWALPGGVSKGPTKEELSTIRSWGEEMLEFARVTLELFRKAVLGDPRHMEMIAAEAFRLEVHDMGLVDASGRVNFYDGQVRVRSPQGAVLEEYAPSTYLDHIAERVETFSYLKFPYLRSKGWTGFSEGMDSGVYRCGPLGRLNAAEGMATPLAQAAYEEMYSGLGGRPAHATLAFHWARLVELLYAAERWVELSGDPEILSPDVRLLPTAAPTEGVGCVEAPRGTLTHHYASDPKGILTRVNMLVGTTNNNAAMSLSVRKAAQGVLGKGKKVTEGLMNRIEMSFRAYDPCMSCATHGLPGRAPLRVTLRAASGNVLDQVER